MASAQALHTSLLRPAVIHMIRAAGFHSARPSVVDTITDLCARHLLLVASNTAEHLYGRSATSIDTEDSAGESEDDLPKENYLVPTITDVRLGLASAAFFTQTTTSTEEARTESLRRPLSSFPVGAREKERRRRDLEDTRDVREFVDWCTGPMNKEIRRIAGVLPDTLEATTTAVVPPPPGAKDDYLTALKKKHSKTGDGARYAGTALGRMADDKGMIKIEGGPPTLEAWNLEMRKRRLENGIQNGGDAKREKASE